MRNPGHTSANAVKATAGGWSTGSSACLTFPFHSLMSSTRREGSEYHFQNLWHDSAGAGTHDIPVVNADLHCNRIGRRPKRFVARAFNFAFTLGHCGRIESLIQVYF